MSRTITLTVRNELDVPAVKQRISERFAVLKATYIDKLGTSSMSWDGDTARVDAAVLGQKAVATVAVTPDLTTIEIKLPLLLAGMSGMIESILRGNADTVKAQPKQP